MSLRVVVASTFVQLSGRLLSSLLGFVTMLIIAKSLGVALYGEYSKIISFLTLFYFIIDFGLNPIFLRDEARSENFRGAFSNLLGLRLLISVGAVSVAILTIQMLSRISLGYGQLMTHGVAFGSILFLSWALFLSTHALFQRRQRFLEAAIAHNLGALATITLLLLTLGRGLVTGTSGVLIAVFALFVGSLTASGASIYFLRSSQLSFWPQFKVPVWNEWLRASLPLGITLIFNMLYFRLDVVIMTAFRPSAEIGAYSLAYKFFEAGILLPSLVMNSVYPLLLEKQRTGESSQLFRQATILLGLVSLFFVAIFYLAAPLVTLVDADFAPSVPLLRLLCLSFPLFYLTSPLMWQFILAKKQYRLLFIYGASMLISIGLNIFFIPKYGATAAAIITSVTELAALVFGIILYPRERK